MSIPQLLFALLVTHAVLSFLSFLVGVVLSVWANYHYLRAYPEKRKQKYTQDDREVLHRFMARSAWYNVVYYSLLNEYALVWAYHTLSQGMVWIKENIKERVLTK